MVQPVEERLKGDLVGSRGRSWRNLAAAKNVPSKEMGRLGAAAAGYHLNKDTADTLLVHGRRDSSHASSNTVSLLDEAGGLELEVELLAVKVERSNDGAIGFNGRRYLRHIGSSSRVVPRWIICFW